MASAELVWQIVKDNSCFLQKRKVPGRSQMGKMGPHFTTEPNNLAGINSWKYSGLANTKSVGIDAAAGGGVAFVTKTSKAKKIRKPSKLFNKQALNGDFRRVARAISSEVKGNFYRPDLESAALAKWSLIYAAQKRDAKKVA